MLGAQFELLGRAWGAEELTYAPPRAWRARAAPTGVNAWRGRVLAGEVHDDNATRWAASPATLGSSAPHAASARSRAWLLRSVRRQDPAPAVPPALLHRFFDAHRGAPGSSRALGWDTMLPTSSCGPAMAPTAVGHTGFTGTSLWVDWERDAYFVLLSNRTFAGATSESIREVRRAFHTAAIAALFG